MTMNEYKQFYRKQSKSLFPIYTSIPKKIFPVLGTRPENYKTKTRKLVLIEEQLQNVEIELSLNVSKNSLDSF